MTGFSTHPRFVEHLTGPHHPERPDRIRAIVAAVREAQLIDSPNPFEDSPIVFGIKPAGFKLRELDPAPADPRWLSLVHPPEYIARIQRICEIGGGVLDSGDTPVCPESYDIALLSCGSALRCVEAVITGDVQSAFSAARPPGHHAEPDRAMGFCLFSNIAVAARYAQKQYNIGKVAIVDFDVHHGNGTQAVFESDPSVLFISLHQHPRTCYPGTGHDWETGTGPGEGFTMNIPFDPGADDDVYHRAFEDRVKPKLDEFRPELLMISAGFDGHRDDPLAQIELSDDCYEQMTRKLVGVAKQHCNGRVVSILEGGYNLHALGRSVVKHLIGLNE